MGHYQVTKPKKGPIWVFWEYEALDLSQIDSITLQGSSSGRYTVECHSMGNLSKWIEFDDERDQDAWYAKVMEALGADPSRLYPNYNPDPYRSVNEDKVAPDDDDED